MNNSTKTMQELAQEVFIAKLSGIAKYKTPNEIWWENEQGDKITIEFINNSVSNFIIREYYESGNKVYEAEFKNEEIHGKETIWYENGNKDFEVEYQNGKRYGRAIWWYEDGSKECEAKYQNGKQHGKYIGWYENGNKRYEKEYQNGKLINEQYYKNNTRISKGSIYC